MIDSTDLFGDTFGAERMWGLKELPLPAGVDWLPPAPGWYAIGALAVLLLCYGAWRRWRQWQRNAYRRDALRQIAALSADTAHELPIILRRAALTAQPRHTVASLRGQDWIEWLNRSAGRELFSADDAAHLDALAYGAGALGI